MCNYAFCIYWKALLKDRETVLYKHEHPELFSSEHAQLLC